MTRFDSRTAKVRQSPEVIFDFATDLRNFRSFVPQGSFSDLEFNRESCSFRADTLGTVTVQLKEKIMYNKIAFTGNALLQNDFLITVFLQETPDKYSEIKLSFEAEMNPFLKMAASEAVIQFLDVLVNEIEKFDGWSNSK